jgi:hypothetical protein
VAFVVRPLGAILFGELLTLLGHQHLMCCILPRQPAAMLLKSAA